MKRVVFYVLVVIMLVFHSYCGYAQVRKIYSTIETKNVLYYKVEEIINMKFGGTTTRYTVSHLNLINKFYLGPENIRIITPVYKEEMVKKKYYIETQNPDEGKDREQTIVVEIAISEKSIEIPENKLPQTSLALVLSNLTELEPAPVVKSEPERVGPDFIMVRAVEVYERVLEKGYKSVYMFKEVANFYYFKDQMDKALKWYDELFAMTGDLEPIYYFRYSTMLEKSGKVNKAKEMMDKYNSMIK